MRIKSLPVLAALILLPGCSGQAPHVRRGEPHQPESILMFDDHGNHLGCSWYCGAPPITESASSTLRDGIYSYDASNAHDTKKDTVWVEGVDGPGIGERIVFSFDLSERTDEDYDIELGVDSVSIINGFARSEELWKTNGRVKRLKVILDGKTLGSITLEDTMEPQDKKLPRMVFRNGRVHEVAFEIAEVYPGEKFEDTAIADFFFNGFGVH